MTCVIHVLLVLDCTKVEWGLRGSGTGGVTLKCSRRTDDETQPMLPPRSRVRDGSSSALFTSFTGSSYVDCQFTECTCLQDPNLHLLLRNPSTTPSTTPSAPLDLLHSEGPPVHPDLSSPGGRPSYDLSGPSKFFRSPLRVGVSLVG